MFGRPGKILAVAVFALWLGMAAPGLRARAPQAAPQEEPPPTIRVTTHMVLEDVVVTDKQGKPVTGLHPEDFVLEENGKPQKIATFVAPSDRPASPAVQLPPGIYSNRPQYRNPGGPITVILLDAVNTPFLDQAYARGQMLKFVQEQYKPGQRMGVFTLTNSLDVLQDLTSDPEILQAALQRYKPQPQQFAKAGRPSTSAGVEPSATSTVNSLDASTPPAGGGGTGAFRPGADLAMSVAQAGIEHFASAQTAYAEDRRAILTLNALNSLARMLGGLPGRKKIIWVTGNMPFSLVPENSTRTEAELAEDLPNVVSHRVDTHAEGSYASTFRQSHAEDIRETSARLANAQVALYPVDARGLTLSTATDSQDTMREMARETGGRAYVNQNEIRMGVERAFLDDLATYTVGYYSENKKYDGKYRSIKVKVKRDGVETQNRHGYFAIDSTQLKGYNPENEVASALGDMVPDTLVAFSARVVPPSANSVKGKVGVDFLVDASTLSSEDAGGGKKLNVIFYSAICSPAGKIISSRSIKVDQAFDANTYQQILQHGLMLHMDMDPQPGQLCLAVQDNRTGLVGTITAPMSQ